jgi:hypothetical protein
VDRIKDSDEVSEKQTGSETGKPAEKANPPLSQAPKPINPVGGGSHGWRLPDPEGLLFCQWLHAEARDADKRFEDGYYDRFALAQIKIHRAGNRIMAQPFGDPRTGERLAIAIKLFDVGARAYLSLVVNGATQKDFVRVLRELLIDVTYFFMGWATEKTYDRGSVIRSIILDAKTLRDYALYRDISDRCGIGTTSQIPQLPDSLAAYAAQLQARFAHWETKSLKQVAAPSASHVSAPARKFRQEQRGASEASRATQTDSERFDKLSEAVCELAKGHVSIEEFSYVMGYRDSTELNRIRRGDQRVNKTARKKFENLLKMSLKDIVAKINSRSSRT